MSQTTSAQGWYPYGVLGRTAEWDGIAWTGRHRLDPAVPAPPAWRHRPFAFLGHLWFALLVSGMVVVGIAGTIGNTDTGSGVVWKGLTLVGLILACSSFVFLVQRHLHFDQLPRLWLFVGVGVVAGGIGVLIASLFEGALEPKLGFPFAVDLWLAGFVEETLKLLVPLLLLVFASKIFGDPRAGVLMTLVSGATFGIAEGMQYVGDGKAENTRLVMGWVRPLAETTHSLWTAAAAAVIWLAAHRAKRALTGIGVAGWLVAVVQHSVHDGLGSASATGTENKASTTGYDSTDKIIEATVGANLFSALFCVIAYLILRHLARELVPPTAVSTNAPHWRPQLKPWGIPHAQRHSLDVEAAEAAGR